MLYRFVRGQPVLAVLTVLALGAIGLSTVEIVKLSAQPRRLDVPYVPTPQNVIDTMMLLTKPGPDDYLVDLGCGDGRIPIEAARKFGTRGFGVDLNPLRIREAWANAVKAQVTDKVQFVEGDLFKTDFSKATILTLYLLPDVNFRLRPRILDLRPGTRVVSHDFDMADWKAREVVKLGTYKTVFYWVVPAKVAGTWKFEIDGKAMELRLQQKFDALSGAVMRDGRAAPGVKGEAHGRRITLGVAMPDGSQRTLRGRVVGTRTIEGEGWRAVRMEKARP